MGIISASELKRRGVGHLDKILEDEGVVYVIHRSRVKYAILPEERYRELVEMALEGRVRRSEEEYRKGDFKKGSAQDLFDDLEI